MPVAGSARAVPRRTAMNSSTGSLLLDERPSGVSMPPSIGTWAARFRNVNGPAKRGRCPVASARQKKSVAAAQHRSRQAEGTANHDEALRSPQAPLGPPKIRPPPRQLPSTRPGTCASRARPSSWRAHLRARVAMRCLWRYRARPQRGGGRSVFGVSCHVLAPRSARVGDEAAAAAARRRRRAPPASAEAGRATARPFAAAHGRPGRPPHRGRSRA